MVSDEPMKNLNATSNEQVCDLVDGRLTDAESAHALHATLSDPQSLQTWHAYHVIGDVLRSPELAPRRDDLAFLARLEQRLAQEPGRPDIVKAAAPAGDAVAPRADGAQLTKIAQSERPVANAAVFRWQMLAGVACVAFVGVLGTNMWNQTTLAKEAQVAVRAPDAGAAPLVVAAQNSGGAMIRDPRLDELMAAHRQLGGHSALQVPAEFLRNAAFEGPNR